jgi:hypothetical protein
VVQFEAGKFLPKPVRSSIFRGMANKIEPDINQLAASIVAQTTNGDAPANLNGKNPAAVALGRLGGLKGGKARAKRLSRARRRQIAKRAAIARWKKSERA